MADIAGLLTRKIGPFPGWAWALGIGGAIFLLGPKLLGKSSGSSSAAGTASGFDPQSFAAGFSQGAGYQGSGPAAPPGKDIVLPDQSGRLPVDSTPPPSVSQSPPNQLKLTGERIPPVLATGGAARNRSASIGSISADAHAYFHPAMKQAPRFPHFVRGGVGGAPVAHAVAVHQLAHQAEIHPARLQALNPRPHRFVRVA